MQPYYQDDAVVIYHGDCRDLLPTLGVFDHAITDPPYDPQTHAGARTGDRSAPKVTGTVNRLVIDFDPLVDVQGTARALLSVVRRWALACCALEMLGDYRLAAGDGYVRGGFWRRIGGAPQMSGDRPAQPGEAIAIMHRALSDGRRGRTRWNRGGCHAYWEALVVRTSRFHQTQKPESLMVQLVADFTDPGETIIDPFMGSGTTLAAARRIGRKAVGIDVDERCCEYAASRCSQRSIFETIEA